jgi:hypothetical protein
MWEAGYAMALGKPLVVVTQDLATLPFDVKDLEALSYDRRQLTRTLAAPLRDVVRDTLLARPGRRPGRCRGRRPGATRPRRTTPAS